jgi:hypothetical protein
MSGIMQTAISNWSSVVSGPTPFDFINPPQLVSASLNGSTQNLSVPNSALLNPGTGDFTIEFWTRLTSITNGASLYRGHNNGVDIFLTASKLAMGQSNISTLITDTVNMTTGAWVHVAVVRISGTTTLYKNGVTVGSVSDSTNYVTDSVTYIGYSGSIRINGYLSNLRVVIGTGVYTGSFTPPTSPLTAITNTALLVSMGNTPFIDTSTNTLTVTNTGTVTLSNLSPFSATWTDSISGIVATVATNVNSSGNNPTYVASYGGGLNIAQTAQTYVDVPTSYNGASGFTISMAANIPQAQGSHYVAIYDGNTIDRVGYYINSRQWVGDGLEVGTQAGWGASNSTTDPAMGTLAWWDFVYNGRFVSAYKNGSVVTGLNNYDMGAGNANTGWLNPLRFVGDESISSSNTMWPGTVYRIKCQAGALSAGQVTTQFNAVRATYGL